MTFIHRQAILLAAAILVAHGLSMNALAQTTELQVASGPNTCSANCPSTVTYYGTGTISQAYPADPGGAYPAGYAVATSTSSSNGAEATAVAAGNSSAYSQINFYFSVSGPPNTTVPITFTGTFMVAGSVGIWGDQGVTVLNAATGDLLTSFSPYCCGLGEGPFTAHANATPGVLYEASVFAIYSADFNGGNLGPAGGLAGYEDTTLSSVDAGPFQINPSPISPNGKSLGSVCNCPGKLQVGNPIDVGTGNKYESVVDYHTAGQNQLSFARYYNGLASTGPFAAPLGNNWRSTYDRYLNVPRGFVIAEGVVAIGPTTVVIVQRANGQVLSFAASGGNWVTDTDVDVTLAQTGAATWALTDHDDTVETYTVNSSGEGLLQSIQARNGYMQTLQYNSSNQLTSVTDSYNRTLTFTYASGLLQTVTTPDGLVLTYGYTAASGGNQLTSVSYSTTAATTTQTYLYENASLPFALTGIIDEDGNRYATWTYDQYGRALTSQHASSADLTTVTYDDTTGNRTVTNALGVTDTYTFTTLQGVPKVTQISRAPTATTAAATEQFTYDANGYKASETDWNGNQTSYINNSHGQPTTVNEAVGTSAARTTTIAYDPTWVHLPASITTAGLATSFTYDSNGEVLTRTLTDTTSSTEPYSTNGQTRIWTNTWSNFLLASTQTPNGNTTKFGYDSTGALTSTTDALKHVRNITSHTGGGLPLTIVDPNKVTTTLTYDARQRLTSSTVSGTSGTYTTSWSYDAAGNLITTTLPDSSYLTNSYDTAHRLTLVTDALGNYTAYTLDALGDRTQTSIYTKAATLTWQHSGTFDALGRVLVETAGAGQTTTRTYDPNGNVLTVADGLNRTTTNSYDALNRLSASSDANSGVTTPTYDTHDRVVKVRDANGNSTSYIRNGFGDVIEQASPDSGVSIFHYDGDANLTSKTDALGIVTSQTFDALDRPLTTTYPARTAENVTYTYDQTGGSFSFGIGRLTSVTDAAGALTRTYEERGNLASETRVKGGTTLITGYTYDGANRVASMTYPDGTLVTYQHDGAGYLSSVTAKPAGASTTTTLATITHLPFGPMNGVTYGNNMAETWAYDKDYRATSIVDTLLGITGQNLAYIYDNANNVSSITDAVNAANSQTLGYDTINRLTSATSGTGGYGAFGWTYDKVGNRLTQTLGTTTTGYTYTPGTNRLASIESPTGYVLLKGAPQLRPLRSPTPATWAYVAPKPVPPAQRPAISPPAQRRPSGVYLSAFGWPMLLAGLAGVFGLRKRLLTHRLLAVIVACALCSGSVALLIGCGIGSSINANAPPVTHLTITGSVHGGQQPVSGATLQFYTVGTTGDKSPATPLITTKVVQSQSDGSFSISNDYTCPVTPGSAISTAEVYLVATGGNPGLSATGNTPVNNNALAMMAALGQCGQLSSSTVVSINELTTVASLAALYPYMSSYSTLGSGSGDASALAAAFALVNEYTNTATGILPGPSLPSGYYASSTEIDTLANVIAACVNSAGGIAGDHSACGNLFSLVTPSGGSAPTDTIGAMLDILNNPTQNIGPILTLAGTSPPFQPSLVNAPPDWTLPILPIPVAPIFSTATGNYTSIQTVTLSDATPGTAIYYTTNGSTPTLTSNLYSGYIVISSSETINAIAIEDARLSGPEASAAYTINLPPGLAITTNANGNITGIPPPGSSTNATFAYNNANRLASVTGTPMAATFVYDWAGQRYSKTDGGLPPTVYSYAQGGTLIAENNGGTVTDYVYADGRPIAIIQPSATPTANQINYVVADRLGTPQVVTNTGGAMVWKTTYQPYGTTGTPSSTITQNLRLPGQYADTETGFSYNLNRDYMPNLGRYLESDPAGLQGGLNLYAYELDNPLRSSDPTGLGNPPSHSPHTPGEPEYVRPNPYVGPVVCFIAGEIVDPAGGGLLLDLASGSACSNIWFLIDHALGNDWTCDPNYWRDFLIAQVQFPDLKVTSALQEPLRLNPRGSLDFAFGEVDNVLGEPSAPPCPLGTERTRGKCVSTR